MYYYKCVRCNHIMKQKIEMKRHLQRKFKCENKNHIEYDEATSNYYSFVKQMLKENETFEELKASVELENVMQLYKCKNCNAHFCDKEKYQQHLDQLLCQPKVTNILNQQNIININFPFLRPFDEEWDVSNIDYALKNILLLSSLKYTKTLEYILKNKNNLNVLINNIDSDIGIVYANKNEKFKEMSIKEIVDISMKKISKHLQDFYHQIKDQNDFQFDDHYLEDENDSIHQKLKEYENNVSIQEKVQEFLTNIYNSKKEDSIKIFKDLIDEDKKNLLDGY